MVKEELNENKAKIIGLEKKLKCFFCLKDPNYEKDDGIRGGTGGEEAALFAADLSGCIQGMRKERWKTEIMSANESDIGGFKEI